MNELDLERADADGLLGLDLDEPRFLIQIVLFQAPLHQSQRERRTVDRHVDLGEKIGHGPDVVLVAVGQNHGSHLRLVLLQESQVGHHQIDAQQLGVGEHHSAIDYDNVFAVADGGHVHAELAQSAQGYYLQLQISLQITHSVFTLSSSRCFRRQVPRWEAHCRPAKGLAITSSLQLE